MLYYNKLKQITSIPAKDGQNMTVKDALRPESYIVKTGTCHLYTD